MASGKKALSDETLGLHHRSLSAFFNQLLENGAIERSPMQGFKLSRTSKVKKARKALRLFTDIDLGRIFAPNTFLPWASQFPHRWWCPILTLYTGARISEIAQLHLADIVRDPSGSLSIQIHAVIDEDLADKEIQSGMTVKGESAVRSIPSPTRSWRLASLIFSPIWSDMAIAGCSRIFRQA